MEIKLPNDVEFIINRLNSCGYRADVVGGPVRDFLLGNEPHDYDITTNATPEQVMGAFADEKIVPTGIKHGTVSLILNNNSYEITTYRIDGEYKDARHPQSVSFTDKLTEDLARRDFTMNAIAYNAVDGLTDVFGGREDVESRIIRAVGNPYARFSEDALRILRAVRFSAVLGFEIEEKTRAAAFDKKELLRMVSAERIYTELSKMISGAYALSVFDTYREIIAVFLPEISHSPLPNAERFAEADYVTRLLSFFALSGKSADDFCAAMTSLKTERKLRELGSAVLNALGKYELFSLSDVGIMLKELGRERAECTLRLEILLGLKTVDTLMLLTQYLSEGLPYEIRELSVDGRDMVSLGYRGEQVGVMLDRLLTDVILGRIENVKDALIKHASSIKC